MSYDFSLTSSDPARASSTLREWVIGRQHWTIDTPLNTSETPWIDGVDGQTCYAYENTDTGVYFSIFAGGTGSVFAQVRLNLVRPLPFLNEASTELVALGSEIPFGVSSEQLGDGRFDPERLSQSWQHENVQTLCDALAQGRPEGAEVSFARVVLPQKEVDRAWRWSYERDCFMAGADVFVPKFMYTRMHDKSATTLVWANCSMLTPKADAVWIDLNDKGPDGPYQAGSSVGGMRLVPWKDVVRHLDNPIKLSGLPCDAWRLECFPDAMRMLARNIPMPTKERYQVFQIESVIEREVLDEARHCKPRRNSLHSYLPTARSERKPH